MRSFLAAVSLLIAIGSAAQTNSLLSGVYTIATGKAAGSTSDLSSLRTHVSTLAPGKTNHPPRSLSDADELAFVKEGLLTVTINDSTRVLGPRSILLIMAGDLQTFRNASGKPVSYYVLSFKAKTPVNIARGKTAGGSLLIDWNNLTAKQTAKGESRGIFNRPTAMFAQFEVHATTLNSGVESHPPHTHRSEEIMLLMKGDAIAQIAGKDHRLSPGDIIFVRPNILHNIRNSGAGQCWYYAIKWVD